MPRFSFYQLIFVFLLNFSAAFLSENSYAKTSIDAFEEEEFEMFGNDKSTEIYDPYENFNRKIFAFNEVADRYFFEHVALSYRKIFPKKARGMVRNFVTNLGTPISGFNSILQGKAENSMATFSSFLVNSTIGFFGIFNSAQERNLNFKNEDFGQTLGHYGIGSGPYLVLPVLGPSSSRDAVGFIADKAVNPIDFNLLRAGQTTNLIDGEIRISLSLVSALDKRESLIDIISDIRKESFDPYATLRSAYIQKRAIDTKN